MTLATPLPDTWAPEPGPRPSLLAPSPRRRVIDLLARAPRLTDGRARGVTAQEVAAHLGVHVTTARAHLRVLVDAHVVEACSERGGRVGRPRTLYRLVPAEVRLDPTHRELSGLVTSHWGLPEPEGSARMEEAARTWALERAQVTPPAWAPATTPGQWLSTAELVVDVMAGWGFRHDLVLTGDGRQVELELTRAPFLAIAARHAPVLYAFRRGLLGGVLERLGETRVDVTLRPHADIAVTTATLTTRTPLRHTVTTRTDESTRRSA
ncbi:helix-turn-helix transcriptional regulator [Arsenicicoccus dermatophilus]|uniref:helix-turn-helix transcriptional regulator n=1 Tax=Arsenicicoccus dermatophilus TaxID=1076331 RepID=UPI001F4CC3A8|nr:helix-turn-helix domain-containing protein [Arsenicicoccus dermatophilus]